MRAVIGGAIVAALLVFAAPAGAYDFGKEWADAVVNNAPFNDPESGALLPVTQVYPRGRVRDAAPNDCCTVKLTMTVLGVNGVRLTSYVVKDGEGVNRSIDRRIDTSPGGITAIQYDLCRSDDKCASHTITRPLTPGTPPPPTGTPTPEPTPSPLVDADGDGFTADVDCSDVNNTVHPGAPEVPGNGIDDDCAGGDQPGKVAAVVRSKFSVASRRSSPRVNLLRVQDAPPGARVDVLCSGRHCPFKQRTRTVDAKGTVSLTTLFRKRLAPGITLDVVISAPNTIAKVARYEVRRGKIPGLRSLCLPLGATKPQSTC